MAATNSNLYELSGDGIQITYSTSSIAGIPQFHLRRMVQDSLITGNSIRAERSALGQLITVVVDIVPDLHTVTLTLVLPAINSNGNEVHFQTFAVLTTQRTSIAGRSAIEGALEMYEIVMLDGTGKNVDF